ncbi:hypothetical protein IW140_003057 [Coemansia sp. RSA 1813]|nr:hypothetical protein EV178_004214 [Coemansia sp. RSA 1646]KAJ1771302.1 hypothetical protein LPJ74_002453 [Coemansia sp. RSA 1843]KAJ2088956.1 hypothetical protein IW138_003797 [Coemansia sp. RSA 986]KAJ2213237.1 hypothetical protein EV179_004024 [Coemansia sp. RSA 487]KAJ2569503.1 hypothetical protein IW140_003057 [Coemansia sp. RSA 1813]
MYFLNPKTTLFAVICLALSQTNSVNALPKSSDSGVEYVKACDSGPDDVTNQCINRIPDDVGIESGNHACAYHEAEVKCLGLCGNTVTWKTSYKNALKRYRLVCARFIEGRLADKEEEEDSNGGDEPPPSSSSHKKPDSDDSSNEDSQADDAGDSSKPKKQKSSSGSSDDSKSNRKNSAQPKKETAQSSASSSQKAKSTASKPSPSATDSAHAKPASPSSKAQSSTLKQSTDDISELINNISNALDSSQAKEKPGHAKNGGGKDHSSKTEDDKEKRLKAMLPTMDPEVAGSPHIAHSLTVFNCILILSASLAYMFL